MLQKTSSLPPAEQPAPAKPRPELSAKPIDKRPFIIGSLVLLLLIVGLFALGWVLFLNPVQTAILRDIAIIALMFIGLVSVLVLIVLIIVLIYLTAKVNDLVQLVQREITPLLARTNEIIASANDTVRTVQSRTIVISDEMVKPVINMAGYVAAVKAMGRALFERH